MSRDPFRVRSVVVAPPPVGVPDGVSWTRIDAASAPHSVSSDIPATAGCDNASPHDGGGGGGGRPLTQGLINKARDWVAVPCPAARAAVVHRLVATEVAAAMAQAYRPWITVGLTLANLSQVEQAIAKASPKQLQLLTVATGESDAARATAALDERYLGAFDAFSRRCDVKYPGPTAVRGRWRAFHRQRRQEHLTASSFVMRLYKLVATPAQETHPPEA